MNRTAPVRTLATLGLLGLSLAGTAHGRLIQSLTMAPAAAGEPVRYTLTLTNPAPRPVRPAVAKTRVVQGAAFVDVPAGCRARGKRYPLLICQTRHLPAAASVTWSFGVQPNAAGQTAATSAAVGPGQMLRRRDWVAATPAPEGGPRGLAAKELEAKAAAPMAGAPPVGSAALRVAPPPGPVDIQTKDAQRWAYPGWWHTPPTPEEKEAALAGADRVLWSEFAADAATPDDNHLHSVFALEQNLALLTVAAGGDTLAAVATDSGTKLAADRFGVAWKAVADDLTGRIFLDCIESPNPPCGPGAAMKTATAVWGQGQSAGRGEYLFARGFQDRLTWTHGLDLILADFTAPEGFSGIRDWFAHNTADGVAADPELDDRTRLAGSAVLNVTAGWGQAPDAVPAAEGRFAPLSGSPVSVPMLGFTGELLAASGDGFRAFEVPLARGDQVLTIVMPEPGRFDEVRARFDAQWLATVVQSLQPTAGTYRLPLFSVSSAPPAALAGLRDSGAFNEHGADFSPVNDQGYLFIKAVNQTVTLSLTDTGLTARAAAAFSLKATQDEPPAVWSSTAAVSGSIWSMGNGYRDAGCSSTPHWNPDLNQAWPFLYALRDRTSGATLWLGQMTNPPNGRSIPPDSEDPPILECVNGIPNFTAILHGPGTVVSNGGAVDTTGAGTVVTGGGVLTPGALIPAMGTLGVSDAAFTAILYGPGTVVFNGGTLDTTGAGTVVPAGGVLTPCALIPATGALGVSDAAGASSGAGAPDPDPIPPALPEEAPAAAAGADAPPVASP